MPSSENNVMLRFEQQQEDYERIAKDTVKYGKEIQLLLKDDQVANDMLKRSMDSIDAKLDKLFAMI